MRCCINRFVQIFQFTMVRFFADGSLSKNQIQGSGDLPWIAFEEPQTLAAEGWAKTLHDHNLEECANLLSVEQQLPSQIRLGLVETLLQNTEEKNLLKRIFDAPLTRSELSSFLHQMDFKNVVKLLRSSIDLLKETSATDEEKFDTLLLWLECLLEAHYTTFIIAKDEDSMAVLQDALDLMSNLDSKINMLASVMAHAKMMKKKVAVQHARSVNLMYSVEIIHL